LEFRSCQEHLSVEHNKNTSNEYEQQQLRNLLQLSNEQLEKFRNDLKQNIIKNDEFEQTIDELNCRNNLLERKLIETMTLIDLRNKTLIDYEQQIEKLKNDLLQKHKDILDKQSHIDQLEQNLINKTAEVAQLTETLETDFVKNQQREKYAEDNATEALNDIKTLQREVKKKTKKIFFFLKKFNFLFCNSFDMYLDH
jgi:chromosome segregation ATPase